MHLSVEGAHGSILNLHSHILPSMFIYRHAIYSACTEEITNFAMTPTSMQLELHHHHQACCTNYVRNYIYYIVNICIIIVQFMSWILVI